MNTGFKPGDRIAIMIGEREIETTIDSHGVQRLPQNPTYQSLLDSGLVSLNDMAVAFQTG